MEEFSCSDLGAPQKSMLKRIINNFRDVKD